VKAGLLVEGDKVRNPKSGAWLVVARTALADEGARVRVLLTGLKPMTWPADFEVQCERGETGQAIDLLGLGLGPVEVIRSGDA